MLTDIQSDAFVTNTAALVLKLHWFEKKYLISVVLTGTCATGTIVALYNDLRFV
jgi:hypothetical protein